MVGRIPLHGPVNADNRRYLTAKATRAGHKLDHLLAALAEPADAAEAPSPPSALLSPVPLVSRHALLSKSGACSCGACARIVWRFRNPH